jgi:hypothetical protein
MKDIGLTHNIHQTFLMSGYNEEHVIEKFYENDDSWKIVKVFKC